MIAYNHYIKFIPELENSKKVKDLYSNVVTIHESSSTNIKGKLLYELSFTNNQGRELTLYTDSVPIGSKKAKFLAFEVKEVVTFFWYSDSMTLKYIIHDDFTESLLEYWSLHIVLPLFFTIEETYDFLHAGAVEIEEKPILFVAESFGGKSTITDFFMREGHKMISDDKVAAYEKNGKIYAVSSHPHHRPYRKMEDLGSFVEDFFLIPKPIHIIYELEKADKDTEIKIIKLKGVEKFKSLRYASEFNLHFLKEKRFEFLVQMINKVPVYKVTVPWDMERLIEVYNQIVKHSKNIQEKK